MRLTGGGIGHELGIAVIGGEGQRESQRRLILGHEW
jgi:hypothetical protein